MKIAYISGPYRSKFGKLGVIYNILKARKYANKYWKLGCAVICPHSNSALFDGIVHDKVFLKGDLELLKFADCIVMIPGWSKSRGARIEHAMALELVGIEVIYE